MKFPINGQWKVDHQNERGLGILATKNISFDRRGFATLANRTIAAFTGDDGLSYGAMVAYQNPGITKLLGWSDTPYSITIDTASPSISADALGNQPTGSTASSSAYFNSKWFVSMHSDLRSYDGSAWTDESVSLTGGVRHPLCVHRGNNTLLVGNGAQVKQYNTAISETTNLTLPSGANVVGIAYNRLYAAIVTWDARNREAWLYIWDGATAAANYSYPLGSNRAFFVVAYGDTFACLNGLGQLLYWTDSGLKPLDALPPYYTSSILGGITSTLDIAIDTSVLVDGEKIFFGMRGRMESRGSEASSYNQFTPTGIWCYDPAVGLYHRHAPSGAKLAHLTVPIANVNTSTGVLTSTTGTGIQDVPPTGTPFVYVSVESSHPISPLSENKIYYIIKLTATTFKVASSYANAMAGTAVTLTSVSSASDYQFLCFPETDFGQLVGTQSTALSLVKTGVQQTNGTAAGFSLYEKLAFSFLSVSHNSISDWRSIFGYVMDRGQNRGYLVTQKIYAGNVTDKFQKLFVKARHLLTDEDQVVVKWRYEDDANMPTYKIGTIDSYDVGFGYAIWTSQTTFTSTGDLSATKTAFDAGKQYEIEFVDGAGSGYLAHISNITYSLGTYTVTIDETIHGISAGDRASFIVDNWQKLKTKGNESSITSSSDPNYSEFPLAHGAKWVQFKIELRGHLVSLEEYEIVNAGEKPAV